MNKIRFISLCLLALLFGCVPEGMEDVNKEYPGLVHETFKESKKVFPNPERGFDDGRNWLSASDAPLTKQFLTAQRLKNRTVLYTGYYLTDYMESDIAPEFLDLISKNMSVLREGGVKCVLRFAYKTDMYETGHPWDAQPERVHRHIEQL